MDHRPKEDMLQDCIVLASITHGKGDGNVCRNTNSLVGKMPTGLYGGQFVPKECK